MVKVTKEGITKFVSERDLQDYLNMGFVQDTHKPEPMVIKDEPKGEDKGDKKAK